MPNNKKERKLNGAKINDGLLLTLSNIIIWVTVAFAVVAFYIACESGTNNINRTPDNHDAAFNDNWKVTAYDEKGEALASRAGVRLPVYADADVLGIRDGSEPDRIIATNTVPADLPSKEIYIKTSFIYCYAEVDVDGEPVYRLVPDGEGDLYETGPGKLVEESKYGPWIATRIIRLPDDCGGSSIDISFYGPIKNRLGMMTDVAIGSYEHIRYSNMFHYTACNLMPFLTLVFSLVLMAIVMLLSERKNAENTRRDRFLSAFIFSCSLYTLTGGTSDVLSSMDPAVQGMISIAALLASFILFTNYLRCRFGNDDRFLSALLWIIIVGSIALTVASFAWGMSAFPAIALAIVLLMLVLIAYPFVAYIRQLSRGKRFTINLLDCGILCFLVLCSWQLGWAYDNPIREYYMTPIVIGLNLMMVFYVLHVILSVYMTYRRSMQIEKENHEALVKLWIQRLNPHFLYNAFGLTRTVGLNDAQLAFELNSDLAVCMRYTIDSLMDEGTVPVEEELRYLKAFSDIQKARFGENIDVDIRHESQSFEIPRLTVQPFVEHAINYGLRRTSRKGSVTVSTGESEDAFIITIASKCSTYVELDNTAVSSSLPVDDVSKRLERFVGGSLDVTVIPDTGLIVRIKVPRTSQGITGGKVS